MTRTLILAAVLAVSAPAWSHGGPGMMGGYGMGPGMMGGFGGGWGHGLSLTDEQRSKMADIRQELARQRWELMDKLHAEGAPMHQAFMAGEFDEQAARKAYDAMAQVHKQMFESWLQARERMQAVLTPEQREQLSGRYRRDR